jgi:hypothetical protein
MLTPAADMPGSIDLDEAFEREALALSPSIPPSIAPDYGTQEITVPSPSPIAPVGAPTPTAAPAAIDMAGATAPMPGAIPPQAGIYTDVAPGRAQWQAWMPSVVESYGMGNVEKAYSPGFSPFYGTYLLSEEFSKEPMAQPGVPIGQGFPDYMEKYQPQKFGVQDWSKFEGQYKRLIDYSRISEADRDSGRSMLDKVPDDLELAQNNLFQNMGMANVVRLGTTSEKKQFALATALARYYKGASVTSNYATRGVEKSLGDIYDRIETQTLMEKPGANPLTRFLDYLVDIDPGRFGIGGESVTYAP